MVRDHDETGVSGVGLVIRGVEFPDGTVVTQWVGKISQVSVWDSIEHMETIHGHGGKTKIEWVDKRNARFASSVDDSR